MNQHEKVNSNYLFRKQIQELELSGNQSAKNLRQIKKPLHDFRFWRWGKQRDNLREVDSMRVTTHSLYRHSIVASQL